jgi:hypothetical protein
MPCPVMFVVSMPSQGRWAEGRGRRERCSWPAERCKGHFTGR